MVPAKPTRVYCLGCFDVLHFGHANSIRQAAALGDQLVVAVVGDEAMREAKGPPVMPEVEREALVASLKWVHEVTRGSYSATPEDLARCDCDFGAHGDDIAVASDGVNIFTPLIEAGIFKTYPRTEGISTTAIIARILSSADGEELAPDSDEPCVGETLALFRSASRAIYVAGCFDLFNTGDLDFLKAASAEGDRLLVGVYSDQAIKVATGQFPVQSSAKRALVLLASRYVADIVLDAPLAVEEQFVRRHDIQLVCEGFASLPVTTDSYLEAKRLGIYKHILTGNELTSKDIVARVLRNRDLYEARNAAKQARDDALTS